MISIREKWRKRQRRLELQKYQQLKDTLDKEFEDMSNNSTAATLQSGTSGGATTAMGGYIGTAGSTTTGIVYVTPGTQQTVFSYPAPSPRMHIDRDGGWVVLDPDESGMPAGVILWKGGKAVKVPLKELLRQAGLEW